MPSKAATAPTSKGPAKVLKGASDAESAPVSPEVRKADDDEMPFGDASDGEDTSDDAQNEDEDEGEDDDETPILGEFRVQVDQKGRVRFVLDSDDDTSDDDMQRSEDTDDDSKTKEDDDAMSEQTTQKSETPPDARAVAVTEESLSKALQAVMKLSEAPSASRQAALLQKAQGEQGLTPKEAQELFAGAKASRKAKSQSFSDRLQRSLLQDDALQKAQAEASESRDVAAYLAAQTDGMVKGLGEVADAVDHAKQSQDAFNQVVSKAISQVGAAVKLIGQRMQVIEAQPVREPKSLSVQPMGKSFAGQAAGDAAPSREELLDVLTRMNIESAKSSRPGISKGGRSLMDGVESAMSGMPLSKGLLDEVRAFQTSAP